MSEDLEKLTRMYEAGAKKLNELLDDIKWRQGDVADEVKVLKAMQDGHEECPRDHFEAQEIVVRSASKVLANEIKEAKDLDAELERVKAEILRFTKVEAEKNAALGAPPGKRPLSPEHEDEPEDESGED